MIPRHIKQLREMMKKYGVKAYVVPGTDPHQSEYLPRFWKRREFISGFTGSAGDAVVTERAAGLWTDSRYYLHAEGQLDPAVFTLFKSGTPGVPRYEAWLAEHLARGDRVGVDPRLLSCRDYEKIEKELARAGVELCSIEENLADAVWTGRPPPPAEAVEVHDIVYAGVPFPRKLERIRQDLAEAKADALAVTRLDDIAWLFNLRGADVAFTPVFIACALITREAAFLYIDPAEITPEAALHLKDEVIVEPYDGFQAGLEALKATKKKVWIDPGACSRWVAERLRPGADLLYRESPVPLMKAVKNETEIRGARSAHLREGTALVRLLIWLEKAVPSGEATELSLSRKLEDLRAGDDLYRGPSFESIVAFKDHGAIVHYTPSPDTDLRIRGRGILILDAGGQYLDGTTDMTRTLAVGEPTEEERTRFTRVLKGHIRLAGQPFPAGTRGARLDALARCDLWEAGLDFGHGVGHGVGSYLAAHEPPVSLSFRLGKGMKFAPGMICSIEPGYYKEGAYGLRMENLVVTVAAPEISTEGSLFLKFEPLTLCPVDLKLVDRTLLTLKEVDWLNGYHRKVKDALSPVLDETEQAWLERATQPI